VDKPWESVLVEGHEFARVFSKRGKSFQHMTSSKFAGNVVRFLPARLLEGFPSLTKNPCKFIFFHQFLPPSSYSSTNTDIQGLPPCAGQTTVRAESREQRTAESRGGSRGGDRYINGLHFVCHVPHPRRAVT
jgi:hypothetical protein